MSHPFLSAIHQISPLSAKAQEALLPHIQYRQLPKNHELLRMGQVSHHMHFIHKGLARIYYYFNELDVTTYFAMDNQFLGAIESLFTQQPSQKAFSCWKILTCIPSTTQLLKHFAHSITTLNGPGARWPSMLF